MQHSHSIAVATPAADIANSMPMLGMSQAGIWRAPQCKRPQAQGSRFGCLAIVGVSGLAAYKLLEEALKRIVTQRTRQLQMQNKSSQCWGCNPMVSMRLHWDQPCAGSHTLSFYFVYGLCLPAC